MDASRFDRLARSLSVARTRRQTLSGALAAALGIGAATAAAARACTPVPGKCGNAGDCCSGVCKGKRGKKRCKAHDTGGCTKRQNSCNPPGPTVCTTATGDENGACFTTTGDAGICANIVVCTKCTVDKDCRKSFGRTAACIKNCAECVDTGGFACVGSVNVAEPLAVRRSFGRG